MVALSGETPDWLLEERPSPPYQFSTARSSSSSPPPSASSSRSSSLSFPTVPPPSRPQSARPGPSQALLQTPSFLSLLRRPKPKRLYLLVPALVVAAVSLIVVSSAHPKAEAWRAQALGKWKVPDWQGWQSAWWDTQEYEQALEGGSAVGSVGGGRRRCDYCNPATEVCQEWGAAKMNRALLYQGTNARLHRFIQKARTGDGFTLAVIGGSVSSGHGIGCRPSWYCENNMHRRIFDHLNDLFPARNGTAIGEDGKKEGKNTMISGAQPATGSGYFSFCFGEHIPSDADLIITELSINDEVNFSTVDSYELLLRGLLDLPSQPAVINAQMFALLFATMYSGGDLQASAASFLDVPTISLRSMVLPDILANNSLVRDYFAYAPERNKPADYTDVDQRHLGAKGHKIMADLVNAYVDMQICELDSGSGEVVEVAEIPRMRMWQHWDPKTITPPIRPECSSTNSHFHEKLTPSVWGGWKKWDWKGEKHYLIADTPGSTISFPVHISVRGQLIMSYQRSAKYGLGNCKCWVDEESAKAVTVVGYWDRTESVAQLTIIRNDLTPGDHTLHCELLDQTNDPNGGKEFRIIAVMASVFNIPTDIEEDG